MLPQDYWAGSFTATQATVTSPLPSDTSPRIVATGRRQGIPDDADAMVRAHPENEGLYYPGRMLRSWAQLHRKYGA